MNKSMLAARRSLDSSTFRAIGPARLFLLALILFIWAHIVYDLKRTHDRAFEQSHVQLENLTRVYAEEVSSSIGTLNYVLIDLREEWKNDPKKFGALVESRLSHLDPSIFSVGVINHEGNLIFSSADWRAPVINLVDRDYFVFHLINPGDELYIDKPLLLRATHRLAIVVTRALPAQDGDFNGVMTLAVSPEYLSRFHEHIDLGENSTITVARVSGELLARSPRQGLAVDTTIVDAPWIGAPANSHGMYRKKSEIDSIDRLHAWRVLEEGKMVVLMGQSVDTLLAPYYQQRVTYLWWGSISTLLLLLIAYFLGRYRHQREKSLAAMQQMEEALARSQKLESIGKLTGGVAHDFNNILQIISSNVELLMMTVPGDPRLEPQLKSIASSVERGSKLAAQLLTFARRQPLHPSPINPETLIADIDDLVQRLVGQEIEVRIKIIQNGWHIFADRSQLENVILNLAANARDAMEGKGVITIILTNESIDQQRASEYQGMQPGDYVVLTVTDTGAGMPPEVIEHVFEPFFTTKPEGKGTGLGLATAYGFVQESRGHIHISSQEGAGTTVKIFLPRSDIQVPETTAPALPAAAKKGTEVILLVEDNAELRRMSALMLEHLGYRVNPVANAQEALAFLEKGEPIDVLFTDIRMPGPVDGLGLVNRAKAMYPELVILVTSGSEVKEEALDHVLQSELVVFLRKPYQVQEVVATLRDLLTKKKRH